MLHSTFNHELMERMMADTVTLILLDHFHPGGVVSWSKTGVRLLTDPAPLTSLTTQRITSCFTIRPGSTM